MELHEVGLDEDVLVVGTRALTGIEGAVTVHVHAEGDAAERGAPIRGVDAVDADPRKTVTPEAAVLPAVQEAVTVCVWRAARDLIAGGRKRQRRSRGLTAGSSRHFQADQLTEGRGTGENGILRPQDVLHRGLEAKARRVVRHPCGIDHRHSCGEGYAEGPHEGAAGLVELPDR